MRIGTSVVLIALGAILSFAISDVIPNVDLTVVGYILMGAGALLLIVSLLQMAASNRSGRVSTSRTVTDPGTGEQVTRNESRDY